MNIPSVPNAAIIQNDGSVSNEWRIFFEQMINQLQNNVSNEGYILPQQDQANISQLEVEKSAGGLLYNSDSQSAMVHAAGTYKNVSTLENLTTSEIAAIPAGQRDGRFVHDTDTGDLKVGFNDQFKTVTTT